MCIFIFCIIEFLVAVLSCTHILALFHALVSQTAPKFKPDPAQSSCCEQEEVVPITSLPRQWKPPKKGKESTMQMSKATFTKDTYDKKEKRKSKLLEDFDPHPLEADHLHALLQKIRDENLCVIAL